MTSGRQFATEEELFERWVYAVAAINPAGLSDIWIRAARAGWMAKADSVASKAAVPFVAPSGAVFPQNAAHGCNSELSEETRKQR